MTSPSGAPPGVEDEVGTPRAERVVARGVEGHAAQTLGFARVVGNDQRFAGRVALVTGGSSGIGAAVARRLRDEGARVASLDLHAHAPDGVLALAGDVSPLRRRRGSRRPDHAPSSATIDILVCSAGVPGESLPTVDVTDDEWRRVMGINADGVFFCNRAVIPDMVERGYGRIVNVASIAGKEGNPMAGAYSASKAAVIAMTKAIGKDVARTGVIVNCVAPAVIETPILDGISPGPHRVHGRPHPDGTHGRAGGGRGAHLLARERGVLVLDRRDVRHLRRPSRLLSGPLHPRARPERRRERRRRERAGRIGRRTRRSRRSIPTRCSCPSRTSS